MLFRSIRAPAAGEAGAALAFSSDAPSSPGLTLQWQFGDGSTSAEAQPEHRFDRAGSFDVVLDDGKDKKRVHLNRSYQGLYVCPMIWRELDNFSSASVCMVLASTKYDESDYHRDYAEFMRDRWGAK